MLKVSHGKSQWVYPSSPKLSKRFRGARVIFSLGFEHAHEGENYGDHNCLWVSLALASICSLRVTGASSSLIPKPCPVREAAASPGYLVEDCCSSWPGKEAQKSPYAGGSPAAPLQRGSNTSLLVLFTSPYTHCGGEGQANGCNRHAKGQGEPHRQRQENPLKTQLHMGKHSSSCLAFGVSWLWSCCYPGFNSRQAQTHQSWRIGGKQQG